MSHPYGGSGPEFYPTHSFDAARNFVGKQGVSFRSTAGKSITAVQSWTDDRQTPTIVFMGKNVFMRKKRLGSTCVACWGYRRSCKGSRIGQYAAVLDQIVR
jgi:hypothetical protein